MKKSKEYIRSGKIFSLIFIVFLLFVSKETAYSQTIRITYPNNVDGLYIGDSINIAWTSSGFSPGVRAELYLTQRGRRIGPLKVTTLVNRLVASKWKVGEYQGGTAAPGSDYRICIKTLDGRYRDCSDRPFRLVAGTIPSITVTNPRSGTVWHNINTYRITWEKRGSLDSTVNISLLDQHRRMVRSLHQNTSNDGWQPWTIQNYIVKGTYIIDIRTHDSFGNLVWAQSEPFEITSPPDFEVKDVYYGAGALRVKVKNNGGNYRGNLVIKRKLGPFRPRFKTFVLTLNKNEERNLPLHTFDWPQGQCYLNYNVVVDPNNEIRETNENNNTFEGPVYGSLEPDILLQNNRVEIIGKGNRVKTLPKDGRITLDRNDVHDHIEYYRRFAVDVRYELRNCGARAESFNALFKYKTKGYKSLTTVGEQQNIRLEPGEIKQLTERVWLWVGYDPSSLVLDILSKLHFHGNIYCSSSLKNWIGWPPELVILSIWVEPSNPKVGDRVGLHCRYSNGGGALKKWWKLRYEVHFPGGAIASQEWEYDKVSHGTKHHVHSFRPTSAGRYKFRCILDSRNDIFEEDKTLNSQDKYFTVR